MPSGARSSTPRRHPFSFLVHTTCCSPGPTGHEESHTRVTELRLSWVRILRLSPVGSSLCPVRHRRPRSTSPAAHGTCSPPPPGTRFSLFMARGVHQPVLTSLRTRFIVLTLLFCIREVDAMPPSLFDVPSVPQVDTIRVLWIVSYHMLPVMSTRRYLTATRCIRNKCGDWYTNVLFRSTV